MVDPPPVRRREGQPGVPGQSRACARASGVRAGGGIPAGRRAFRREWGRSSQNAGGRGSPGGGFVRKGGGIDEKGAGIDEKGAGIDEKGARRAVPATWLTKKGGIPVGMGAGRAKPCPADGNRALKTRGHALERQNRAIPDRSPGAVPYRSNRRVRPRDRDGRRRRVADRRPGRLVGRRSGARDARAARGSKRERLLVRRAGAPVADARVAVRPPLRARARALRPVVLQRGRAARHGGRARAPRDGNGRPRAARVGRTPDAPRGGRLLRRALPVGAPERGSRSSFRSRSRWWRSRRDSPGGAPRSRR